MDHRDGHALGITESDTDYPRHSTVIYITANKGYGAHQRPRLLRGLQVRRPVLGLIKS
jgi:hypothetical protein